MTNTNDHSRHADANGTDPIDADAAQIDARSEDAAEEIAELIEHARDLGRDAPAEVEPDVPQTS